MADFGIRFFLCNILICAVIGIFLAAKRALKNCLTSWMQSTLKISPVEQVMLLTDLYNNSFDFSPKNVDAVKDSICLFSSENRRFYGKTGTGRIDGHDVNGWFVGFVEADRNTYFFSTNIQNDANANGSNAAEITGAILSNLHISFLIE